MRLINELHPKWIIAENVARLLTIPEYNGIIHDLEEAGYSSETYVLRAHDIGAPHMRKRVFIVANSDRFGLEARYSIRREFQSELTSFTSLCRDDVSRCKMSPNSNKQSGLQDNTQISAFGSGGGGN